MHARQSLFRVVFPTPPQISNRQPRDERVKESDLGTLYQTAWRTGKEYDVKAGETVNFKRRS